MASLGSRLPHIGSPFVSTPADTLDSHLLTQSFSLFSFSSDFLAPESDHRDWSHLVGPLASGLPVHLIPFAQLVHTPRQPPSPTLYALPYSSLPVHWTQRLSSTHTLLVGTDFAAQAASLPQAAEAALEALRVVSAVESPSSDAEGAKYWQWTGVGRYSAHFGATARLPSLALSSVSPSMSKVIPYISSSLTATASQARLAVSHASFRAHVRPFAAEGDRGLLTAETLLSRGVEETWANLRLAYTHRLSEAPTDTALSNAYDSVREVQDRVQSAAADVVPPSLVQQIKSQFNSTVQPAATLAKQYAPSIFPPPPPPRPLLPWRFPSYLSLGLSHSSPLPSPSSGAAPQRSFRLTDSSGWLSGLTLSAGLLLRPQHNVAVQVEYGMSEQRLTADARLWFNSRRRRFSSSEEMARLSGGSDGMGSVVNGMYVGASMVADRKQPTQSHTALTFGLSYMY